MTKKDSKGCNRLKLTPATFYDKLIWYRYTENFHICAGRGVALSPIHATECELLFHYADQALYAAKHKGRSCYCICGDTIDGFSSVLSEETPYKAGMR